MLRSIGGKGSKMKKTFLLILILPFSVVFGKSVVEISAEIIINPPDERKIHATPHLLNIALHGHSLPQDQKDALIVKGFSFDGPLVNRTAMVRSEANGLDASLDYGNLRFHYTTSGSNGVCNPKTGQAETAIMKIPQKRKLSLLRVIWPCRILIQDLLEILKSKILK